MIDPITTALIGSTVIIAIAAASWAALRGWHEWLDYKRLELASHCGGEVRLNALARQSTGGSTRICRMMLMAEPPSLDAGEATDKGSIKNLFVSFQNLLESGRIGPGTIARCGPSSSHEHENL